MAVLPDVPTLKEQGLNVVGEAWIRVLAPPGASTDLRVATQAPWLGADAANRALLRK